MIFRGEPPSSKSGDPSLKRGERAQWNAQLNFRHSPHTDMDRRFVFTPSRILKRLVGHKYPLGDNVKTQLSSCLQTLQKWRATQMPLNAHSMVTDVRSCRFRSCWSYDNFKASDALRISVGGLIVQKWLRRNAKRLPERCQETDQEGEHHHVLQILAHL